MYEGQLRLRPSTPNIGAEVCGADVRRLGEADTLRATLVECKVIVLRNQDITAAQYADLMRIFGEPVRCAKIW